MDNVKECHGQVVCVNPHILYALTVGNIYTYTGEWFDTRTKSDCYIITNDGGVSGTFEKDMFVDLKKHREEKLKQLLNE